MIEIQIVPSDIRRGVRYVFLDRRRVMAAIVALIIVLTAVIGSMAAAPTVIRRVYKDNYLKNMREERDIQRARLHENAVQMASLERQVQAVQHDVPVVALHQVRGEDRRPFAWRAVREPQLDRIQLGRWGGHALQTLELVFTAPGLR